MAASLPHTFAHSANADAYRRCGAITARTTRDTVTIVSHLHEDVVCVPHDADHSRATTRVAMYVGETLLHDAKQHQLQFPRQAAKIRSNVQHDLDPASLRKAFNILLKRGRMEKKGECAQLADALLTNLQTLAEGLTGGRIDEICGLTYHTRRKWRILPPLAERAPRAQEGLLGHFFGARAIVAESVRQIDKWPLPAAHDVLKRAELTRENSSHISTTLRCSGTERICY